MSYLVLRIACTWIGLGAVIVRDMVIRQHLKQSKLLWCWNGPCFCGCLGHWRRSCHFWFWLRNLKGFLLLLVFRFRYVHVPRYLFYSISVLTQYNFFHSRVSQISILPQPFERDSIFMHVSALPCVFFACLFLPQPFVEIRRYDSLLLRSNIHKSRDNKCIECPIV